VGYAFKAVVTRGAIQGKLATLRAIAAVGTGEKSVVPSARGAKVTHWTGRFTLRRVVLRGGTVAASGAG